MPCEGCARNANCNIHLSRSHRCKSHFQCGKGYQLPMIRGSFDIQFTADFSDDGRRIESLRTLARRLINKKMFKWLRRLLGRSNRKRSRSSHISRASSLPQQCVYAYTYNRQASIESSGKYSYQNHHNERIDASQAVKLMDLQNVIGNTRQRNQRNLPLRKIRTTSVSAMMKCNDRLDFDAMNIIAENLGRGWENIFRKLNCSDGKIEQFTMDHTAKGLKEVIYQLLLDWSQSDENATLGNITNVLWLEHWDIVYLLKLKYWKVRHK